MLRWLSHNIWNILLSIVLAVVVWVVAVNEANPNREDTFRGIPVTLVHQPPDTEVYAPSATSVAVTLSAPQSTWPDLGPGVISATLDLSDAAMGEGLYRVSVSVPEASRRLVRVVSVDPPSIGLTVEPRRTRLVPVEINLVGDLAIGFRASGTTARPAHVTVGGPASWVERVSAATSDFSVQGASASVSQTLPLKPVDADGQIVPNVVLDPDQTTVEVDVEQLAGFANLAVKAVLTGTQASGYRLAEVNVTPPNVTVIGGPDTLAAMPGFVETEPVDIGGAQSDIEKDVQLVLPPDEIGRAHV